MGLCEQLDYKDKDCQDYSKEKYQEIGLDHTLLKVAS